MAFLLALAPLPSVLAQEVTSQLSSPRTRVGEPVQMVISIQDGRGADVPDSLSINGLRINLVGRQTQFQMGTGMKMSSSLIFTYLVVPQFEGNFTIPPIDVKIQGRVFRTQPMNLVVSGSGQVAPPSNIPVPSQIPPQPGRPAPSQSAGNPNARPFFGELILSKKKAYVGEVIPAELRFYFNARIGGQVGDRPSFGGEGFTVQKFSNASKREQVVDGENYIVFSFQTSVTPVKAGSLEIPPAKLEARLQMPGEPPQGLPDIFGNFGGMIPPGMFSETRDITLETRPVTLEVMALPKEGRPEDFSGAIGKFTLEASVSPKKATAGEPVTLKAAIGGQGNFEAFGAPALTADDAWRSYPPSDKFTPADAIGYTGEKTFEYPLIARQDQTRTPGLSFSYFDPTTGKYSTLTQNPLAVEVKAGAAPTTPQQTTAAASTSATASPTPAAPASTPDISVMAGGSSNWKALFHRREFWIANIALTIAWLAAFLFFSLRKYSSSEAGAKARHRKSRKDLLSRLAQADADSFDALSMSYLCAAFQTDPLQVRHRITSSGLDADFQSRLLHIVERHEERLYAAGGSSTLDPDSREATIATLRELEKRHV